MTRIIFRYDQEDRPRAEVEIQNGSHKFNTLPIIDSGADMTIIPKDVGETIHFNPPTRKELKKLEEMKKRKECLTGLSGVPIDHVTRNIRMQIGDYNFSLNVGWLFNKNCHVLLGRDVFEKFDVLFKQNPSKKIIFESNREVYK